MVDGSALDKAFEKATRSDLIPDVIVRVQSTDGRLNWEGAKGGLDPTTPYFIASATKLYVTATVLALRAEGRLDLEQPVVDLIPSIEGTHVLRETDHTPELTVRHLMAHTSGLPDYFSRRRPDGADLSRELMSGRDRGWDMDKVVDDARRMGPLFAPDQPGKAHYSDTNYQLLGRVIEVVCGMDLEAAFATHVYRPLGLTSTYLYTDPSDDRPFPLRYRSHPLHIPQAMASFGPDGGIVSTVGDCMRFVRGFFGGELFPAEYLAGLYRWNRIFYPMQSGIGVHRFSLPAVMSGRGGAVEMLGHSGLSGAFMFLDPARDLFFAGTVNQIAKPSLSFRLMVRLRSAVST